MSGKPRQKAKCKVQSAKVDRLGVSLALAWVLIALVCVERAVGQTTGQPAIFMPLFTQRASTGRSTIFAAVRGQAVTNHVFTWSIAGGPSGCTLLIEKSTDEGATWATESTETCTSSGSKQLADASYLYLTVNLSALSGGTNPNITVEYSGYRAGQGLPVRETEGGTGNKTALTAGSVVFKGTNGYDQNNANFFWNNSLLRLCLLSNACVNTFDVGAGKAFITASGAGTFSQLTGKSDAAGNVAFTVQGFSGQTANLHDWKNSAGTVLASVSATGVITPSAGESYTGRAKFSTAPIGAVAYGSFGTNTTLVAGTIYWAEVFIPRNITLTGVGVLNGGTVGTDKWIVGLYTSAGGAVAANSALAGVTSSGANVFQEIAFTSTYAAVGPGRYWIAFQANGTTDKIRTVAASTFLDVLTKSVTGSFGTLPSLTVPTTFTADVGPIAYVY